MLVDIKNYYIFGIKIKNRSNKNICKDIKGLNVLYDFIYKDTNVKIDK